MNIHVELREVSEFGIQSVSVRAEGEVFSTSGISSLFRIAMSEAYSTLTMMRGKGVLPIAPAESAREVRQWPLIGDCEPPWTEDG